MSTDDNIPEGFVPLVPGGTWLTHAGPLYQKDAPNGGVVIALTAQDYIGFVLSLLALSCAHIIRYTGGIDARDGIEVASPASHFVVGSDGQLPLATVSRAQAEADFLRPIAPVRLTVRILSVMLWLVAASIVGTLVDVGGRKVLSASVPGSLELTELLMVVVIFAGLPLVSLRGEHVVFDSLDAVLSMRSRSR